MDLESKQSSKVFLSERFEFFAFFNRKYSVNQVFLSDHTQKILLGYELPTYLSVYELLKGVLSRLRNRELYFLNDGFFNDGYIFF